jgi:hypothetical protein
MGGYKLTPDAKADLWRIYNHGLKMSISVENFPPVSVQKFPPGLVG